MTRDSFYGPYLGSWSLCSTLRLRGVPRVSSPAPLFCTGQETKVLGVTGQVDTFRTPTETSETVWWYQIVPNLTCLWGLIRIGSPNKSRTPMFIYKRRLFVSTRRGGSVPDRVSTTDVGPTDSSRSDSHGEGTKPTVFCPTRRTKKVVFDTTITFFSFVSTQPWGRDRLGLLDRHPGNPTPPRH